MMVTVLKIQVLKWVEALVLIEKRGEIIEKRIKTTECRKLIKVNIEIDAEDLPILRLIHKVDPTDIVSFTIDTHEPATPNHTTKSIPRPCDCQE